MLQPWGKADYRFQAAGKIISRLMDSIYSLNPNVEFGLRVYGHQSPAQNNDCYDSKQEVMFSKNNYTQMQLRLASIRPLGVSPIAYSLKEAALNDLTDEQHNAYSIILITDGGESCDGNICDVVKNLIARKIYFKPYILSLVDYAPLKDQYTCLGTYLQVADERGISPAITQIVDAYRSLLIAPIQSLPANPPPATIVDIPAWIPDRKGLASLPVVVTTPSTVHVPTPAPDLNAVQLPKDASVKKPLPEHDLHPVPSLILAKSRIKPQPGIGGIRNPARARVPAIAFVSAPLPEQVDVPVKIISAPAVLAGSPAYNPGTALKNPAHPAPTAIVNKSPVIAEPLAPPPPPPPEKTTVVITPIIPEKTTVKVTPAPAPPVNNKPKEAPFTTSTEDASETSLAILFTDGHGKFYATTPQLQLLDANSGKLVKQFYRTVDASGNPDPVAVASGSYNLLIVGKANMLMRRIVVEEGKKNTIIVKVTNGSLRFVYENNPNRPVTEFDAIVNIRFEPGPTIKQRCTAELEYPPGNYYIEVNTLPVKHINTDIDFGATTVIAIPEPGYVQFNNNTPLGDISLYTPLGNKFVRFGGLRINGIVNDQRLRLQPGAYEVHWVKNPKMPFASETVQPFLVKSNSVTEIDLH